MYGGRPANNEDVRAQIKTPEARRMPRDRWLAGPKGIDGLGFLRRAARGNFTDCPTCGLWPVGLRAASPGPVLRATSRACHDAR